MLGPPTSCYRLSTNSSDVSHSSTWHRSVPAALVHEAYLRLVGPRRIPWKNRAHFYATAEAMRRDESRSAMMTSSQS